VRSYLPHLKGFHRLFIVLARATGNVMNFHISSGQMCGGGTTAFECIDFLSVSVLYSQRRRLPYGSKVVAHRRVVTFNCFAAPSRTRHSVLASCALKVNGLALYV
jgi:hypothetical protein